MQAALADLHSGVNVRQGAEEACGASCALAQLASQGGHARSVASLDYCDRCLQTPPAHRRSLSPSQPARRPPFNRTARQRAPRAPAAAAAMLYVDKVRAWHCHAMLGCCHLPDAAGGAASGRLGPPLALAHSLRSPPGCRSTGPRR